MQNKQPTVEILENFLQAFNNHNLDEIMEFFTDDCVLEMPKGSDPWGHRYEGKENVRTGLATRFDMVPDVAYLDDKHWVCGNFGVSEWTLKSEMKNLIVHGTDHLEFENDKIKKKNSYWKIVT